MPTTTARPLIVRDEQHCHARTYNLRDDRRTAGRIVAALLRAGIGCTRSTSTTVDGRLDVVLVAGGSADLADRVVRTVVPADRWDTEDGSASTLALVWCLVTAAAAVPLLVALSSRLAAAADALATDPSKDTIMEPSTVVLAHHLRANHYPPVTEEMVPHCRTAIQLAERGEWDSKLTITGPGGTLTVSVRDLVDDLHLHDFIS